MKKIVSVGLLLALLAVVFSFSTDATPNPSISTNAEILFRELNAYKEANLGADKYSHDIFEITMETQLYNAKTLESLGIKEIVSIQVGQGEYDANYRASITDTTGNDYYLSFDIIGGSLTNVIDGGGKYILGDDTGNIAVPDFPDEELCKWWQRLPDWLQWILRYMCFGWRWM